VHYRSDLVNLSDKAKAQMITIAILDTGILHNHPLLKNEHIKDIDFTGEGPEDLNGHGTVMFLLLLSQRLVGENFVLLNVKVLDKDNSGDPENIKKGMTWAVEHGAQILNMSLGVPKALAPDLCDFASDLSKNKNVLIVAAAGNDPSFPVCPAAGDGVVSVGAEGMKPPMEPVIFAPGTISFSAIGVTPSRNPATPGAGLTTEQFQTEYIDAFSKNNLKGTRKLVDEYPEFAKKFASDLFHLSGKAYRTGNCAKTLDLAILSYRLALEARDAPTKALALNEIGVAFYCSGDPSMAEIAYNRAIEIHQADDDAAGEATSLGNLGELQNEQGKTDLAIKNLKRAAELSRKASDKEGEVAATGNLCTAYFSEGKRAEAIKACNDALDEARTQHLNFYEGRNLLNLGLIYQKSGENNSGVDYLRKARDIFLQDGDADGLRIVNEKLEQISSHP
jgi:tetratricopeptide (TPR) repeat protein